jgi:hypothetical protein
MKNLFKCALAAIVPALLIAACGGGDDSADDRLDLADPKLRLVHAIPLAPAVSLFRNDVAQASEVTDVPYKSASHYFDIDSGNARWDVRTATTPSVNVGSAEFEPSRGTKYTLIAVADAGSLTDVVRISDPYNKSVLSDEARVRVFHAAFTVGRVDVYLTAPTADIASLTPTFADVGYKEANPRTGSDSLEVDGGNYRLRITTAGTKDVVFNALVDLAENADWLLTTVPAGLTASEIRVLVIKSDDGKPAVELTSE